MDKAIVYYKPLTSVYGDVAPLKVAEYETNKEFNEIISDYGVIWAKIIDMETGKVFKSYIRKEE